MISTEVNIEILEFKDPIRTEFNTFIYPFYMILWIFEHAVCSQYH